MCRSRGTLAVFAAITTAMVPLSILMLIVDDQNVHDSYSCEQPAGGGGVCQPCDLLEPYTTTASIDGYLEEHSINPADYGWPAPDSPMDWGWFFQYVCVDLQLEEEGEDSASSISSGESASGESNSSSSGGVAGRRMRSSSSANAAKAARRRFAAAAVSSSASDSGAAHLLPAILACCCGDSLATTDEVVCPAYGFQVTPWSWLWFVLVVMSTNGVVLAVLGYIFLECGCIESTKGPLELIADDLHLRRSEGR